MINDKSFEIQNQIRQSAQQMNENLNAMKNWEIEMKNKESEMMKKHEQKQSNERNQKPPIRSKLENFQKFADDEDASLRLKAMNLNTDNKESEEQENAEARRQEALEFKDKGNKFVKGKEYESAIKMYSRAIELCRDDPVFYSNRSQCYLSLEKFKECIDDASKAIELDPKSSKSFYRQMIAYEKLGDDFKALKSCRKLLDLSPEDQMCKNSYDRIHNRIMEAEKKKDKEKIRWSRLSSSASLANFVSKPPHLSSKRPMKKVPVRLYKAASPIPEAIIDKMFDNMFGENVPEPETDSKLFKPNFLVAPQPLPPKVPRLENPKPEVTVMEEKLEKVIEPADEKVEMEIEPTLQDLQAAHPITVPSSGPQFYMTWKEFDEIQRFFLLKHLAENNVHIGKLVGAQINSEILSDIIEIVSKHFPKFGIPYVHLLNDLGNNSEVPLLAMFLNQEEKTKLNELIQASSNGDNAVNNLNMKIKQIYKI